MNLSYFIARKVAASGTRSFSRLIIRIAVIAVALSVAVMIVATALIAGFKKEISSKIFGFWGHIHITDTSIDRSLLDVVPVDINQDFYPSLDTIKQVKYWTEEEVLGRLVEVEHVSKGGVRHIQVFAIKPGIIKAKDEIEGIILKGIGQDFDWQFLENYLQEGKPIEMSDTTASRQILISRQTANRLKVGLQDSLDIHFVEKGEQLTRRFYICGIYKTGLEEYDQKFALVDINQIRQILGWTDQQVSGFEVFIDDIDDLIPITNYVYYDLLPPELYAETIREKFREIFEWLELQNINEVVILALMILVAIINMVTALMILILERTNMIGTLKALGSSNWSIRRIFIYYAAYIIITGLFWGNLVGIGLCVLQDQFEFIKLSEENYYLSVAPVEIRFWSVFLLNIGTLVITLIFLIAPSYLVTRIDPVKAIRFKQLLELVAMKGVQWKLESTFWNIADIVLLMPRRLFQFFQHFYLPVAPIYKEVYPRAYSLFWGFELILRLLEILGVGDLYNILSNWLKFNTRPLNDRERILLETIFGTDFPWHRIGIDEWAVMGPPQSQICYVSFWTINSWRRMSDCLLVHEMVHTWQYHHLGIVYIPRALVAQRTIRGYDYGGVEALQKVYRKQGKLQHFNLEQQADIVADYCRIKKGLGPSWGKGSWIDLPLYQYFVDQLI